MRVLHLFSNAKWTGPAEPALNLCVALRRYGVDADFACAPDAGEIEARPPGKKPQTISLLSGGEQAMTAIALLFSIFKAKPSPFCVLDEVDAPLDDANIGRFLDLLDEYTDKSQFIIISHNKQTMARADALYGVTQQERGVSQIVSVRFDDHMKKKKANTESAA